MDKKPDRDGVEWFPPQTPEAHWPPEAYGPFVIDGPSVTPEMWRLRREQQPELTPEMIAALEATEEPKP